jgi:DNA processing protein
MVDPYWLALQRAHGVGNALFRALIETFGDAGAVFSSGRGALSRVPGMSAQALEAITRGPDESLLASDSEWLGADGNYAIAIGDERYPALLNEIADPPALLFVRGDPALLLRPQIAIVGSRNPTPTGVDTARAFAAHLARAGLVITSGLAEGIDAAAHEGALSALAPTVAVLGTGVDRVYPARHRELAHRVAAQGALVSEFPVGTSAAREHFPRRNRIISGLSLATLVVEAGLRSGSLITARLAAEQGREVMAIPGSIHSPLARGCHALIRQGAKLVETASDVLEELAPLASFAMEAMAPPDAQQTPQTDDATAQLLECMGFEPVTVDTLVERTGLTAGAVSSMLLKMEIHGAVAQSPGGRYVRVRSDHRSSSQ